ncbi:MAG: pepsin/retropepsin-like aspartic protease family protein [Lysobacterales bacterium]
MPASIKASHKVLGLFSIVALFAASASDLNAQVSHSLSVRGDRLFIPVSVNGHETRDALLDSGAELSLVDQAFAHEAELVTMGSETARGTGGGEEEVSFAHGVNVEAAGLLLENLTVAVMDLSGIAERLVGSPVAMILGRELFDSARLAIDIEGGTLAVVDRDSEPSGVRLPTETHMGIQTIPVTVEGLPAVQADFDLGNGSEVLVGAAFAERAGLLAPERIVGQKTGGGIGGEVVRDRVVLKELQLAGIRFVDVPAVIDRNDNAADLNVGVRILRHFRITTDFEQNAVWLEPR